MMTSNKISNNKLYETLKSAMEADKRYWVQNDAKLRAVITAKSYDEFRQIVGAAHLQPLSNDDKGKSIFKWNRAAVLDSS